jgi:hypothetical protein
MPHPIALFPTLCLYDILREIDQLTIWGKLKISYNITFQESIWENSHGIFLANYSSISMQF